MSDCRILLGDVRETLRELPDESVQCVVTSPPYWGLRDYGAEGQIGLEATFTEYVEHMVGVFREVRRVLKRDGVLWLNLGDCYATGAGKVGGAPGGGKQGQTWAGRGNREGAAGKHEYAGIGPMTQPNRMPQPGLKPKDLVGVPWRVAFALQADGWWLRQDVIWAKPNPMPESVRDRCTKAHEYIFLLSKSERYFYDAEAVSETGSGRYGGNIKPVKGSDDEKMRTRKGLLAAQQRAKEAGGFEVRNRRSVWTITTEPYPEAHFATFPTELPRICILAGSKAGDTILDPFNGSGTTGQVALELGRDYIGCELNPEYVRLTERRLAKVTLGLPLEAAA